MFNKPNVFGRDESTQRRDAPPVLASGSKTPVSATTPSSVPGKNGAAATSSSVSSASASVPPLQAQPVAGAAEASAVAKEPAVAEGATGARLIVGPDVKLRGAEILDCDTLVVEGRVEATMDSRVIRIDENGSFSGKVSIDIAEVYGTFDGELTARSQLIIHSTGRVSGTIRFGKLVVDEGGELCGEINVLTEAATKSKHGGGEPKLTGESPSLLSAAG